MSGAEMEALIQRVEAAEGPDRELDAEIAVAAGTHEWRTDAGRAVMARIEGPGQFCVPGNGGPLALVPHYTASLDAAVSLVPSGWAHHYAVRPWLRPNPATAGVWQKYQADASFVADAATPELALLVAILKALLAMEGGDHG